MRHKDQNFSMGVYDFTKKASLNLHIKDIHNPSFIHSMKSELLSAQPVL